MTAHRALTVTRQHHRQLQPSVTMVRKAKKNIPTYIFPAFPSFALVLLLEANVVGGYELSICNAKNDELKVS